MRVFFGFDTAVAYWRSFEGSDGALPASVRTPLVLPGLPQGQCVDKALSELGLEPLDGAHILTSEVLRHKEGAAFKNHAWGREYPPGSFVKAGYDVFVESPELSFVRMASAYPIARAVEYGCELCGRYALSRTEAGFVECPAVTTPERLRRYVQRADGLPGQVARHVGHRLRDRVLGTPLQRVELRKMLLSYVIERAG